MFFVAKECKLASFRRLNRVRVLVAIVDNFGICVTFVWSAAADSRPKPDLHGS